MTVVVGRGSPVFSGVTGGGRLVRFVTPDDVIAVLDEGEEAANDIVALVQDAGATFLAPIEADLAGILCRSGDIESHLAIISRDFRIPCLMGVVFDGDEPVDGTRVQIDTDVGTIALQQSPADSQPRLQAPLVLEYPFNRTTGPVIGAFLTGLREQVILGIKRSDGSVLCPPTEYDPLTSDPLTDMVQVGPDGELVSWTWVDPPRPQSPWPQPHGLGFVLLDGADTPMLHGLLVDDPGELSTGMRLQPRWRADREGHICDLEGFVPAQSEATP